MSKPSKPSLNDIIQVGISHYAEEARRQEEERRDLAPLGDKESQSSAWDRAYDLGYSGIRYNSAIRSWEPNYYSQRLDDGNE